MADIFISYSRQEPGPTKALAADLESLGYSTWWDTSLLPGDSFPEDIRREIENAKAVIVIWSEGSAKSEWVAAEAQIAAELKKLITVHVPGFNLNKVPLPFNRRNSESVANREKLYAALQKIGAKPVSGEKQRTGAARHRWLLLLEAIAALGTLAAVIYIAMYWHRSETTIPLRTKELIVTGRVFRDCPTCPEMVVLPAGQFHMGSPATEKNHTSSEGPEHSVIIAKAFTVGKYDITFKEYNDFVEATGGVADGGGCEVWTAYGGRFEQDRSYKSPSFSQSPSHPAVCVSWQAAATYANWLTTKTGKKYRLLSEAEWEYAARANSTTRFFFGEDEALLCTYANGADRTSAFLWGNHLCGDGAGVQTAAVGSYKPNGFGLYDMIGNVFQWTQDCFHQNYQGAPSDGSPWMSGDCTRMVIRGGSWENGPKDLRSATRSAHDFRGSDRIGFRVARELTD